MSARRLMAYAVEAENWELAAMLILAGSLEYLQLEQARESMTVAERFGRLCKMAAGEVGPVGAMAPVEERG